MKKEHVLLVIIVILGFALRVWQLGNIPSILNRDEAALAYNALLLQHTGKDEWGRSWPVVLQSFGDDKLIGYPLMLIPFFALFGYQDWVVKLPSVFAGTFLVLLTYVFIRRVLMFEKKFALVGALFIAIEPVFFFYSRIAFEANVALFFTVAGLFFLFSDPMRVFGFRLSRFSCDVLAILSFFLAIFIYNTPLILLPFIAASLLFLREIKKWKKWLPVILGIIVVFGIGMFTLLSVSKQKSGITIFTDESTWKQSVDYRDQFHGITQKLLGNKAIFFGQIILQHYAVSFSPYFLVIVGGWHPWHKLPGFGHFGWTVYMLGWLGILLAVLSVLQTVRKKQKINTITTTLLFLLVCSLVPSVITVDSPHATRSLLFLFFWVLFAVIGLQQISEVRQLKKIQKYLLPALVFLAAFESIFYFDAYFKKYGQESWQILKGGYGPMIQSTERDAGSYKAAVIDDGGFQYILTAWYLQMSPSEFFSTINRHLPDKIGLTYGYKVGRYRFVKSMNDRVGEEKIVVHWSDETNMWQVEK